MRGFTLFCVHSLAACLLMAAPAPALAVVPMEKNRQLLQSDLGHAKSAFYFADRNDWHEAVQHASRARNPLLRSYMTWRAMQDAKSTYRFADFQRFLASNPGWPRESRLVLHAEDRLYTGDAASVNDATLRQWFSKYPPISGKGKLVYAEILRKSQGESATVVKLIRDAWVDGDFDTAQEKAIMLRYGKILRQQDYVARADRLIWQGKHTAAGRMMFAVPKGHQHLFEARIKLALNKPGVNEAIARTPANLRNDPGLLYERMQWRYRKGLEDGVEEILLAAPATIPHASKWWRTRHIRIREALDKGRPSHALKLLANHGQNEGIGLADALWLQGWINLVYMEQPQKALTYFTAMEKAVSFPVSKSRAFYWMGRAAEASGQREQAHQWYAQAATYDTTFYGQLGVVKSQQNPQLRLPQTARPTAEQLQEFHGDPRVKAVYMLAEMGRAEDAYTFIGHLMEEANTHSKAMMTAELGMAIKRQDYAVQASKDAMKQHLVLPQTGYPYYRLSFTPGIEEALVWAITRQESLFNPTATSSAGAVGLMQVLPSTAREVARKSGMPYQQHQLTTPLYNLRIGSTYLGQMIDGFGGSYILAIAAYNAGPGRVRQWLTKYGPPGRTPEAAIDWIERIPFSETRNYVQRVLENLQVYRAIVNPNSGKHIQLEKDLVR